MDGSVFFPTAPWVTATSVFVIAFIAYITMVITVVDFFSVLRRAKRRAGSGRWRTHSPIVHSP
ncbi:photosystem II protein D1 [Iris pallida]|uniref:Photosystem II protein D1 (Chloroplast) n=1 Tax=Iris pallida TaxID=29817 RepID=A0AAX6GL47_IRIPA|nr:photosystem II protein D1 [Iris pallida]